MISFIIQCDVTGVIPDAMAVMGKMSNYTMAYHAYSIARIGTAPTEFPANASGKWGGLFGTVFNEEYQLSITFWNNRYYEYKINIVKCKNNQLQINVFLFLF